MEFSHEEEMRIPVRMGALSLGMEVKDEGMELAHEEMELPLECLPR